MRKRLWLMFIGVAFLLAGAGSVLAQASVTTDVADYLPGSMVFITGTGFQAGETVQCQVLRIDIDDNSGPEHELWTVTADEMGSFQTSWLVTPDESGATLQLTATGLASGLTAQATFADSPKTWTGGGADNNWSTVANWGGTAPVANDLLYFDGSTRLTSVNNIAASTAFNAITFNSTAGAFTLSGNAINLAGGVTNNSAVNAQTISLNMAMTAARTFDVVSGGTLTVGGVISGGYSLTKVDAGTLALGGVNTYSGGTIINGGTLAITADSNLGNTSGGITFANGGTLLNNGTGGQSTARAITLNSGGGVITMNGPTMNLTGTISGGGGLTSSGSDLILTPGAANNIGVMTVNSGRLFVGSANAIGNSAVLHINNGATLDFQYAAGTPANTMVFASGACLANRSGSTIIASTGNITFPTAGTMIFNQDDLASTAITVSGAYPALTGALTIQVGGANASVGTVTLSGAVSGSGSLTKTSTGTLVLGSANTYTGGTTVSAGSLTANVTGSLGSGPVSLASGATMTLPNGTTETVSALYLNGVRQAAGTWGGSSSSAANKNSTYFPGTTTGVLTVGAITVTAQANTKTYDGTTSAATVPTITAGALAAGDTATLTETYNTRNQGTGETLIPTATIKDSGNNNVTANYTITYVNNTAGVINKASLTVTATANTKTYDGTTSAAATPTVTAGSIQTGDTAPTWTETYDTKNAGSGKTLTPAGVVNDGNGGANYSYTYATAATGTINTVALSVAGAAVTSKTYDGTTAATITGTLSGIVGSDAVTLNGTGTFNTAAVGSGIAVTSTSTLGGAQASNYTLTQPTGLTGTITPKALTAMGTLSVPSSKVYDGTTGASVSGSAALQAAEAAGAGTTVDGAPYSVDAVSLTGTASYAYNSKDVATATAVTESGLSLTGTGTGNYTLTAPSFTSRTITGKVLTAMGTLSVPASKVYDGTTSAAVTGSAALQAAEAAGSGTTSDGTPYSVDSVSLTGTASYAYNSKDVATATTVTESGLSVTGTGSGNYTLTAPSFSSQTITAKALTAAGTLVFPASKAYDGTTTATPTTGAAALPATEAAGAGTTADGKPYSVDAVSLTGTASYNYNSKAVGIATTITESGLSLMGTGNGNYTLTAPTFSSTITARSLTVTATGVNRPYDGTTTATVNLTDNKVSGDAVTDNYTSASFATASVGTGKAVSVSGISISGADAGNYTANTTASTTANITARAVQLSGTRTYDGTTVAAAGILTVVNNVDAGSLTLSGNATLAGNNVGSQAISNYGTPVRVQSAAGNTATSTAASFSVATAATTAGNTLVAVISTRGTAANQVSGISGGGTWTRAAQSANTSGSTTEIWYATNITAGVTSVTISQASVRSAAVVLEYSGLLTVSSLDQVNSASSTGSGTSASTGTTPTTIQANEVWVGGVGLVSSGYTLTVSGAPAFTSVASAASANGTSTLNAKVYALEYMAAATGTATSGGTVSTSSQWSGAMATFKAVLQSGTPLTLGGSAAGNYTLTGLSGSVTITPKALTAAGTLVFPASKVYDGTATATPTSGSAALLATEAVGAGTTADGMPYGVDAVSLTGTASYAYNSKDVATATTVTESGLSLTGTGSGNYTLTAPSFSSKTITTKALTALGTLVFPTSKVYDGTATATPTSGAAALPATEAAGAGTTADGIPYSVDAVSLTGTASYTYNSKDVATATTVTESGLAVTGTGSGNYTLTAPSFGSKTIAAKALTAVGNLVFPASKLYDGTTTATLISGAASLQPAEAVGSGTIADGAPYSVDTVSLAGTASYAYNSKDVATATTIAASGLSLTGAQAGNYALTAPSFSSRTITAKALTMSGLSVPASKVYNGNTAAVVSGSPGSLQTAETAGSGTTSDGKPYTGDTVSLTGTATGTYDSKDVASATTVTYGGVSLTGAQAANYALTFQSPASATITAKALTAVGTLVFPASKVYDGTTTATPTSGAAALQTAEAAGAGTTADGAPYSVDSVSLTGTASYAYNSKDVATATTVTESGLSLTGTGSGNYTLTAPSFSSKTITAAPVTVSSGITANNKVYDGTATATISSNSVVLSGVVAGDAASVSLSTNGYSASFASAAVGTGKTVTVSGLTLAGGAVGNYALTQPSLTANIVAGAAAKLAFTTQPASTTAGSTLAGVVVQIQDQFGNNVSQSGTAITLTLSGSTLYSGTNPQTTDASGKATFNDLVIRQAGSTLAFTANGGGLTAATSGNFSITPATASLIAFVQGPPSSVTAGATFSPAVTVAVTDAYGNGVGSLSVTLSLNGTGTLTGGGAQTTASGTGIATFSGLSVNLAGSKTITATVASPSLSVSSSAFTVTAGAIDHYAVSAAAATRGTAFNVTVTAQDVNNNTVTSDSSTVVTMTGSTANVLFDSNGDSSFNDNSKTLSGGTFIISTKDMLVEATTVTITARDGNGKTGSASVTFNSASGDFRSVATANWNVNTTWNTWNGSSWVAASSTPTGAAGVAITLQSAYTVTDNVAVSLAGVLDVQGTLSYSGSGAITVGSGGIVRNSGTINSSTSTLTFSSGATYEHNYTTTAGTIPTATWASGSTCTVIGYTTDTTVPAGLGQGFDKLTWNCFSQSATVNVNTVLATVNNTFTVASTGTGVVTLGAASTYTGATVISGGTVQLGQSGLAVTVPNFSFETPVLGSPYYQYTPSGASWTFVNAGIAQQNASNPWWSSTYTPPNGSQGGFIQGGGGYISQSLNFPVPGKYTLNFNSIGRAGTLGPNPMKLQLDGVDSGITWTPNQTNWTLYTVSFTIGTGGNHTVSFVGTATAGDLSSCIDNVVITGFQPNCLPASTPLSIASGAVLDLNGVDQTVASLSNIGTGGGMVTNLAAAGSPAVLTVGTTSGTATFSGAIGDGTSTVALVKTGSSTEILAGASTYTGGTTINAGTLRVNGQTGSSSGTGSGAVAVNAGGILSGNGRIAGAVTVANSSTAVLYPNSSSTLDLGGNLTFGGSSAGVKFDLSSSAASGNDKVVLESKTLTCGGAQITINSAGTLDTTDYVLFDAGSSGTISGSFNATPVFVGTPPSYPAGYSIVTGTRYVTLHNSLPAYTLVITAAANTKTYDGTTSAAATPTLAGSLANGDTATLTEAYSDRNVGTGNKTLIPAVTITNSSNVNVTTNYTITLNSVSTGTISAKALTVAGITAGSTTYDGTTTAKLGGTAAFQTAEAPGSGTTSDGVPYSVDAVSPGTVTGTLAARNVGTQNVTASVAVTGSGSGNYTVTPPAALTQTVTAKGLTMSGLSVPASKVYNGTTAAVVSGSPGALAAAEAVGSGTTSDGKPYTGDTVSLTGTATGAYNSKDVATATTVTFGGVSLTGAQAANYVLTIQSPASATITPAALTITANNQTKSYGATLTLGAGQTAFTSSGLQNGETVGTVTLTASGGTAASDAIGTYSITPSAATGGTFTAGDYTIIYVNGTLSVVAGAIDHYAISASSPRTAGVAFTITVTAQDFFGNVVTNDSSTQVTLTSTGTVQFDSNGNGVFGEANDNKKTLANGTFTIQAKDVVAETVTLTATDANSKTGTLTGLAINPLSNNFPFWRTVTINHTKVVGIQTNFPVLISITDPALADHAQTNGFDIFFTASDGSTILSYERESYTNTSGALLAWVKVPYLSSATDTVLYVYYGNPNAADQQNRTNAWDPYFKSVWHLDEVGNGTAGEYKDSTSSANNGQGKIGSDQSLLTGAPSQEAGKIGPAQYFTANDQQFIESANNIGITSNAVRTVTFWTLVTSSNRMAWVGWGSNISNGEFEAAVRPTNVNNIGQGELFLWGYGANDWQTGVSPLANGWHYHAIVHDGAAANWYLDGIQISSNGVPISFPHTYGTYDSHVYLGYEYDVAGQSSVAYLDGYLDEVHIANTNRSLSWIQTEYYNQVDPTHFITLGSEQTALTNIVTSSANPSVYGQPVSFTATLTWAAGPPSGTVQFLTNGVNFGAPVALVNGTATSPPISTLAAGSTTVTEVYTDGNDIVYSTTGTLANGQVVTGAPLTITANNATKTYGQTASFSGTAFAASGLQNGETVGSVTLSSSGAPATAAVGTYSIVPSAATGGTFHAANYSITYATTGTLTVGTKGLTVTANSRSKTYGLSLSFAGTEFTTSGLINSDSVASVALASSGAPAIAAAGNYAIVPSSASGSGLGNYTISYVNGTLTVTPKALTVTAVADSKTYDGTTSSSKAPAVSGLVNGDLSNFTQSFDTKNVGAGKSLIPAGTANDGNGGNNYSVTFVNNTSGAISAASLTVTGITATSKVYDQTTTATLNLSGAALSGTMSGDIVALSTVGAAGAFGDKTVGNGKTVQVSGLTISGRDAGNYTLTQPTTTANITPVGLTVTGITANNKVYDDTTAATLNVTGALLVGVLSGDTVSLVTTNATGTFADELVGSGKTVTVGGLLLAGSDAGNYTLTAPTTTANITPFGLTVTGITANNKVYDGTTSASLNLAGALLQGVVGEDQVTLVVTNATGAFTNASAGPGKTVVITGLTIIGLDAGNYTLTQPAVTADITSAGLTITANNATKSYGQTATFSGIAFTSTGLQNGETIGSVTLTSSGAPATAAAGTYSIVPSAATGGSFNAANYAITYATTGTLTVSPTALTVTANSSSKTYGQTVSFAGTEFTTSGLLNSDSVTSVALASSGAAAIAAVGNYAIVPSSASGSGLGNYTISYVNGTLTVSPQGLTVTAVADTKTYDGTTSSSQAPSVTGLVNGDLPNFAQAFDTKNVGAGKSLIPAGTVNDGNGGNNYSVTFVNNTSGAITAASLTVTGITATSKVYDRTTTASLNLGGAALSGVIGGDLVQLSTAGATGAFGDKTVGNGKTVQVSGLTIGGRDAGNYTLTQPTTTANITPAGLTVTGITANNKAYDETTAATLNLDGALLAGVLSGDTVSLVTTNATGAFADALVGNGKTVTVSGLTLAGADAGNYTLTAPTTTANITAAGLTVTGITANNKVYDGTCSASLNLASALLQGVVGSDRVTLVVTGATGAFTNASAGLGKTVVVTGLTLSGQDAGNYTLTQPTTTADITPAGLTVTGVIANNKVYDGTAAATLNLGGAGLSGVVSGDIVSLNVAGAAGVFADRTAADGKLVTVSGLTLAGRDAANYLLTQPTPSANITPAGLTVTGVSANSKVYDRSAAAALSGTPALAGAVSGDGVTLGGTPSATFADKIVANNKPVTVTGFALTGTDAGNYSLAQPAGLTANITPVGLTVTGITANNKPYDGTTAATLNVSGATLNGVLPGDAVALNTAGAAGTFADASPGNSKTVYISGLTLNGADSSNYSLTQPTTTANITATLDHFAVTVTGPQTAGTAFDIAITALDINNNILTGFNGSVDLTTTAGTISPTNSDAFIGGVLALQSVTVTGAGTGKTITATDHAGTGKTGVSGPFDINAGAASQNLIETAADGSGVVSGTANVPAGSAITVYAITRDAYGNFVGNPAGAWSLQSVSGGVLGGDLVASGDGKSATFTGHLLGSAILQAIAGGFTGQSGVKTVVSGAVTQTRLETAADGSGSVVGARSIVAGSSLTVYAITRDANLNFVANPAAAWTLIDETGGVVSGDLTPNGASAVFTGHLAGTGQIQAVAAGFTANSGLLTVVPGAVNASNSTISVSPASVSTDAGSTTTITVTARDANGNAIPGIAAGNVVLAATGTGNTLTQPTAATDANGQTTGTLASTRAEVKTVSVTIGGTAVSSTASVTFTPGALDHFTVGAISTQTAAVPFSIGVTAQDGHNNTITNYNGTVDLATTAGSIAPTVSSAFTAGVLASQSVSVTQAGTGKTITVTDHGGTKTGTSGTFTVVAGSLDHFAFGTISSPQVAGTGFTVAITAQDASNNTVTGFAGTVDLTSTAGTISPATSGAFTGGVLASQSVTVTGAGAGKTITATDHAGTGKTGTSAPFTVNPNVATHTTVETAADGTGAVSGAGNVPTGSAITVYAVTRDAYGNFVSNPAATWSLQSILGGVVSGDLAAAGDNKSATFTGHLLGSAVIQALAAGFTGQSGVKTVVAGAATQTRVETAANGSGTVVGAQTIASGNSITVYAITRDANANFVANSSATWTVANQTGGVASGDLVAGGASAVFTAHVVGTGQIQAVAGGFTGISGVLTVVPGAVNATNSTVTANPTSGLTADNNSYSTITVTLRDAGGSLISGQTVALSTGDLGNDTLTPSSAVSDANGQMTSRLTTFLGGTKKVTARVGTNTLAQQASVTFVSLPPNASTSTVTASPSSNVAANGIATSTITVTLKDRNYEPVVNGLVVTLSVSGTGNTISTPALTDANGVTTATLTSTNVGTKTITATVGSTTISQQPTVTFVAGPASAYKIAASTATPAPGAGDQLTLTLVDAGGNAVTGFSGDKTLTFSGLAIAADGTYPTVTGKNGLAVNLGTTQAITFASGVSSSASGAAVLRAYSAQTATLNVSDSGGLSSTSPGGAGVSLTLTNVNPVAQAFSVYRAPGLSLKMLKTDLLAGATDANHDTLTVSAVQSQSTQGATLMVAGAYVYYLPNSAGSGDTFTYTVSDGNGGTNTKTVTVYVAQQGGAAQQISYGAGGVTINFAGIPGYSYDVQRSSDAGFSAPTVMTTTQAPSAGVFIYIDSNPPNPGPSFYRLIQH